METWPVRFPLFSAFVMPRLKIDELKRAVAIGAGIPLGVVVQVRECDRPPAMVPSPGSLTTPTMLANVDWPTVHQADNKIAIKHADILPNIARSP